ncbi:MAG: hypothetical protein FWB80_11220 [Defluviitaleaceae bacterium]|nr:hypothetical protein [Defluviitaleaceae bacterium]
MKKHINLMPNWAVKAKAHRRLIIILALVQIAIFLLLGLFVLHVNAQTERTREHSRTLSEKISALDEAPTKAAEELRTLRELYAYISEITGTDFNSEWLDFITFSLPINAELSRIDYSNGELILLATTDDLTVAGQHRENLTVLFEYVTLVRITRTDGLYVYEIRVI